MFRLFSKFPSHFFYFCTLHISKWLSGFDCELRLVAKRGAGRRTKDEGRGRLSGPQFVLARFYLAVWGRRCEERKKTFRQLGPLKARGHKFHSHHIFPAFAAFSSESCESCVFHLFVSYSLLLFCLPLARGRHKHFRLPRCKKNCGSIKSQPRQLKIKLRSQKVEH